MNTGKKCLDGKWEDRAPFKDPIPGDFSRPTMENEAKQDLCKPIWQLVCDVHEEANAKKREKEDNLIHATKRLASMMGRVALENEHTQNKLICLTWAVTVLTTLLALDMIARWFLR
ncbi:MAG: hypothetical protein HY647_10300 [Acidobacteria bacterium]|nr:hypothetical protein [Acidobacteriota bacterium]